jgi:hypothetical protein
VSVALAPKVIPAEWRGKARVFRDAIGAEDEPTGRLVTTLAQRLKVRIKERRDAVPRPEDLRGVAFTWERHMPPRSRLDLAINLQRKSLEIREVRLSSSVYRAAAWGEHEAGLVIMAITLEAAPLHYEFKTGTIAHVSVHAIARRLQRGRGGSEADVLRDLGVLGRAHEALAGRPDGADFEVPAADGFWIGTVETMRDRAAKRPGKSLLVRTFLDGGT